VVGNCLELLLRLEITAERRHMKNIDQKFDEFDTEVTDQTAEFVTEMRKEFATFTADIKRIIRFHRYVIIGSLAALMTVFSVLTPLLN